MNSSNLIESFWIVDQVSLQTKEEKKHVCEMDESGLKACVCVCVRKWTCEYENWNMGASKTFPGSGFQHKHSIKAAFLDTDVPHTLTEGGEHVTHMLEAGLFCSYTKTLLWTVCVCVCVFWRSGEVISVLQVKSGWTTFLNSLIFSLGCVSVTQGVCVCVCIYSLRITETHFTTNPQQRPRTTWIIEVFYGPRQHISLPPTSHQLIHNHIINSKLSVKLISTA